jgi:hypothetical protein
MRCGHLCALSLSALILVLGDSPATAQDSFTPVYKPTLHVQRAAGDISIDGWLNDPGWQGAGMVDHFVENEPGNQVRPPVETKALVTYDEDKLYVAIIAYDNPADIRASMCARDMIYSDDNVGFFLDTYGDAAWAYTLNVNPYGVQGDALWTSGFGEDSQFDLVWESAGRITDSGYQVELAIPFASLRFSTQEEQVWRVEFFRHHQRDVHHQISWAAYDRDESCWPCQWGTVTGIENVAPGKGIEIIPALVAYQSGQSAAIPRGDGQTDSLGWFNDDLYGDLSLTTKYSISSNATAELALNPDFSQVEADADQIDVNSATALSFPEKRPFFQEGADLFQTWYDVVYTRSINDPAVAAKFTYRRGATSLGYLGAYDEHSPVIIPFEDFSTPDLQGGKSTSNIVSLKHTFADNSRLGLLMTDRRFDGGGEGTALSLDGSLRLTKSLRLAGQAITTHTTEPDDTAFTSAGYLDRFDRDPATNLNDQLFDGEHTAGFDGESFWGQAYYGSVEYSGRNLYISPRYTETSPTFRTDNGFETRNNRRQAALVSYYKFRFNEGLFQTITPQINLGRVWNADGVRKDEFVFLDLSTYLRKYQIGLHSQYMFSNELYRGTLFEGIWNYHQCLSVTPSKVISFGGNVGYGDQIAYGWNALGRQTRLGLWCSLMPLDRVQLENTYSHVKSHRDGTGEELFDGFIARSRISVQFSRELSLRFVVQHNEFSRSWDFDPLITYQLNPFTLFYVGTTYDYEKDYGLDRSGDYYAADGNESCDMTRLKSRQFFMKLQYLFQL